MLSFGTRRLLDSCPSMSMSPTDRAAALGGVAVLGSFISKRNCARKRPWQGEPAARTEGPRASAPLVLSSETAMEKALSKRYAQCASGGSSLLEGTDLDAWVVKQR